ncbi:ABC transporter permease [Pectobacterium fontis]|uniref:ABC transporter permease n=1 Tax=Pectobacterium fontis TaxID=2558042 RepID=A0A7V8IJ49_9GAMM|nr:ABC transporter permease [Pectobacterium fontis]
MSEHRRQQRYASIPAVRNKIKKHTAPKLIAGKSSPFLMIIGPIILFLIWGFSSYTGILPENALTSPWGAINSAYHMLMDGTLYPQFLASAQRAYSGLGLGIIIGLTLALLAGLTRTGDILIDGIVQIKRAIPTLALIPLAILWLGIGEALKIVLITFSVIIPVYINTHSALKNIDIRYVELARTVGLSRLQFIRRVALPGALPGFFVGLRFAVTSCWAVLVVLEQINTTSGIGYLMNRARDYGQTDIIVVGLVVYMVLGLFSDGLVRFIQKRAMRYSKSIGS